MKRRTFLGAFAATFIGNDSAPAQDARRVGILLTVTETDMATQEFIAAFQQRMRELGWLEGRNIRFEKLYAGGGRERIRHVVSEMLRLAPNVIVAQNTPMVDELRKQQKDVPVVFVMVSDPVGDGFAQSLARPGGNTTGFTNTIDSLGGKWVELLKEAVPGVSRVGYLFNRAAAPGRKGEYYLQALLSAASAQNVQPVELELTNEEDIKTVIDAFVATGGDAIIANSDSFILRNRDRIISAANRHRLPSIFASEIYAGAGGLMSYGADPPEQWRGAAGYVDRILRGESPANLPVQLPNRMILTVNLKTARELGVDVPLSLQLRANKLIE